MQAMTPKERSLYLRVWAGLPRVGEITERLHFLDSFFPRDKLEAALRWLIRNELTGARFVEWVRTECIGSNLEMHRTLLAKIEKEKPRAIIAGKDFRA